MVKLNNQNPMQERMESIQKSLSNVGKKLAVISGKGGVGKTTISVNLAALLAKENKVGLVDADVDCPNINNFLGIKERFSVERGKIIPIEKFGMKIASFASIQEKPDQPTIWRGPMLSNAIMELLEKVNWEDLDYLVIDLPPGTSDAALTVMQIIKPDGIVVVTTPQTASVLDAKKSANMARQLDVPILGILENMAGEIFGSGGGKKAAEELGINFLGQIGLNRKISKSSESGKPFILEESNPEFQKIAEKIISEIEK